MRSWIGLSSPCGLSAVRSVCITALVLVLLALVGGLSLHPALGQNVGVLNVMFSMDTLPSDTNAKGQDVLCQGQTYKLLVEGISTIAKNQPPRSVDELITVVSALNPINPKRITRMANTPKAVFIYEAKESGEEVLDFESDYLYDIQAGRGWKLGHKSMSLEVRACEYEVTFVYEWTMNTGSSFHVQFAQLAKTLLIRNDDGTFEGDGSFKFEQMSAAAGCKASIADFGVPTHITGKLLKQEPPQLELNFKYDKTTFKANATCEDMSKSIDQTIDISGGAPKSATFPEKGGVKELKVSAGLKPAKMFIIVNKKAGGKGQ